MRRRSFLKTSAISSLVSVAGISQFAPDTANAVMTYPSGKEPFVAVCASNDSGLTNPVPLSSEVTTEQIREIVFMALNRDTSVKNLRNIVKPGSRVVIKPNIVCVLFMQEQVPGRRNLEPDGWGLVTDIRTVKAVVEYLLEKTQPGRITIAEGPASWYTSGGKYEPGNFKDGWNSKCTGFGNLSYDEIIAEANKNPHGTIIERKDLNEDEAVYVTDFDPYQTGRGAFQYVPAGDYDASSDKEITLRKGILLPKTVIDRDVLITVPSMKTHGSAGTTLFMKNFIGCVHSAAYNGWKPSLNSNGPFLKHMIHKGSSLNLVRGVADLAAAINPDYGIVDGFWAVENFHSGQCGVYIHHNVVVAGSDCVAAESVTNRIMGFNPLDSDLLRWCNMKKLGEWHPDRITVAGADIPAVTRNFAHGANMYTARGIRKWYFLPPLRKPLKEEEIKSLAPRKGVETNGKTWTIMDGDAIIDRDPQMDRFTNYKQSLYYTLPESEKASKNNMFYLALWGTTSQREMVGELLIGIQGGDFDVFLNGDSKRYDKEPFQYDPTASTFLKFGNGENLVVIAIKKTARKGKPVKIAINICNQDGDRLTEPTFEPKQERQ